MVKISPNIFPMPRYTGSIFLAVTLFTLAGTSGLAQDAPLRTLRGNTHRLARAEFDQGAAPSDLPMERMLLVLNTSPTQKAGLEQLLKDQQASESAEWRMGET